MKEEIEKILKLQKNLLITGDILSGKTTKILWPILDNIINNKEDFIVLDSKGEYLNNYYDKLDNYHKIIINLHDLTKSEGINFFDIPYEFYKNGDIDKALKYLETYTNIIFNNEKKDYFDYAAEDVFVGVILGLFNDAKKEEINFLSIKRIFDGVNHPISTGNYLQMYFKRKELALAKIYAESTVYAPKETCNSILSIVNQKLRGFISDDKLVNFMSKTTFEISEKPQAIFLVADEEGRYNLITQMIIRYLYMLFNNLNRKKVNFILDNIDLLDGRLDLDKVISKGTYHNIRFMLATRSREDFENKYGKYINHLCESINIKDSLNEKTNVIPKKNNIIYPTLNKKNISIFDFQKVVTDFHKKAVEKLIESTDNQVNKTNENSDFDIDTLLEKIDARIEELNKQESQPKE